MPEPVEIPLDDNDRLVDPPLLDLFREETGHYVATLVPSDDVSAEATLSVNISKQTIEGSRIAVLLKRIETICHSRIRLATHLGGGDYTLHLMDGRTVSLSQMENADAVELFDRLKQIAVDAEISFRIEHSHAPRWRPAV